MAGLQRFITYINKYENDEKMDNSGFAKIEIRGNVCRMEVHIRNMSIEQTEATVYLFAREAEIIQGIPVGNMEFSGGNGDVRYAFDTKEMQNFGRSMGDMQGIFIPLNENSFLASQWKEGTMAQKNFRILYKQEAPEEKTEDSRTEQTMAVVKQRDENAPEFSQRQSTAQIARQEKKRAEEAPGGQQDKEVTTENGFTIQKDVPPDQAGAAQNTQQSSQARAAQNTQQSSQAEAAQKTQQPSQIGSSQGAQQSGQADAAQEVLQKMQQGNVSMFRDTRRQNSTAVSDPDISPQNKEGSANIPAENKDSSASSSSGETPDAADSERDRSNGPEDRNLRATELPLEEFWEERGWEGVYRKLRLKTGIYFPFEGREIECIRMSLNDLREFPQKYWYLGKNSFLLHGFFNYRHILFGEMSHNGKKEYFIGVPGVFQNQERIMASMFGFPEFRTAENTEYKTGNFGYWYRIL